MELVAAGFERSGKRCRAVRRATRRKVQRKGTVERRRMGRGGRGGVATHASSAQDVKREKGNMVEVVLGFWGGVGWGFGAF